MKPTREQLEQYARENPAPNGTWLDTAVQTAQWAIEETLKDCIEIPDVSKWPGFANGIACMFTNLKDSDFNDCIDRPIKYIPRPQQPIKFKVGDPVFWKQHLTEIIFRITAIDDFDITISSDITAQVEDLKPAKLEDLGKEWEAIK
jgi:hypothetical protein